MLRVSHFFFRREGVVASSHVKNGVVALVQRLLDLAPREKVDQLRVFSATLDYDPRFLCHTIKIDEPTFILTFKIDPSDANLFRGDTCSGGS